MSTESEHFTTTVSKDFFQLMCGDYLGGGVGREVYVCAFDPTMVIKFESGSQSFQNVAEWQLWENWQYATEWSKWLAPCLGISPCGRVLLQKRTEAIPKRLLPKEIPTWATDTKQENWGLYKGKPVIHDYGYTAVMSNAGKRMKKADFSLDF